MTPRPDRGPAPSGCGRRVALAVAGIGIAGPARASLGPLQGQVEHAPDASPWRVFLEDGGITLENAADASRVWEWSVPVFRPFAASLRVSVSGTPNQPAPGAAAGLWVGFRSSPYSYRDNGFWRSVDHTTHERLLLRADGEVRMLRTEYRPRQRNPGPHHGWGGVLARVAPGQSVLLAVTESRGRRAVAVDGVTLREDEPTFGVGAETPGRAGVVAMGLALVRIRDIAFTPPPGQRRDSETR